MALGTCTVRVSWRTLRALSVIAATLPCADELGETGRDEALAWCVEVTLEKLRAEGVLTGEDEAYIRGNEDAPGN